MTTEQPNRTHPKPTDDELAAEALQEAVLRSFINTAEAKLLEALTHYQTFASHHDFVISALARFTVYSGHLAGLSREQFQLSQELYLSGLMSPGEAAAVARHHGLHGVNCENSDRSWHMHQPERGGTP